MCASACWAKRCCAVTAVALLAAADALRGASAAVAPLPAAKPLLADDEGALLRCWKFVERVGLDE
jgi:hypothetical protein